MKIERIDHIHVKTENFAETCAAMEKLTGIGSLMQLDFSKDQGNLVGYSPFPVGFEIMQGTADIGSGVITNRVDPGVFAISLKVTDLEESVEEMKGLGYACVWEGAFGGISEALFDTTKAFGFMIELIGFEGGDVTAVDNGGIS